MGGPSEAERSFVKAKYGVEWDDLSAEHLDDMAYGWVGWMKHGKFDGPPEQEALFKKLAGILQNVVVAAKSEGFELSPELEKFYSQSFIRGQAGREAVATQQAAAQVHAKSETVPDPDYKPSPKSQGQAKSASKQAPKGTGRMEPRTRLPPTISGLMTSRP